MLLKVSLLVQQQYITVYAYHH